MAIEWQPQLHECCWHYTGKNIQVNVCDINLTFHYSYRHDHSTQGSLWIKDRAHAERIIEAIEGEE